MTAPELVASAKDLKPISPSAIRLIGLLGNHDIDNDTICQTLRSDSVLTARLLRACNSPVWGFGTPVESIDQALFVLGHQHVLRVVLSVATGPALATAIPGYAVEARALWEHSVTTAVASEMVATTLSEGLVDPSVAFTAGLLHDIGKIVLGQVLSPDFQSRIRSLVADGGHSRAEAEQKIVGVDHPEVGACLLRSWHVPDAIVEAVALHHQPALSPGLPLSCVVHFANCLAHLASSAPGWEAYAMRIDPQVAERLRLTPELLDGLVARVCESTEKVGQLASTS